jgi:probable addiction module antidote protein
MNQAKPKRSPATDNSRRDGSYEDWLVDSLKDPEEAAAYLGAVIEMRDQPALLLALRQVAKAHSMARVAKRADLGDKTLFKVLNENGNPTIDTLSKTLSALGLRLNIEPIPAN